MKTLKKIFCCALLGLLFCGCNKSKVNTYANISNKQKNVNLGKGQPLTVGDIYSYIRENEEKEIAKKLLMKVMKTKIDLSDDNINELYKKYLNDYFKETFVNNENYMYDGEFNENLVVKYLRSEGYDIVNTGEYASLLEQPFTYNYSDYIEKEVNYEIYSKILRVVYIISEKSNLIEKNEARKVSYYSVKRSSSTDYDTITKLEGYLNEINKNYNSDNEELIRSLSDVAELYRKEDLKKIEDDFAKVGTSDDSSFNYFNQFTTCKNNTRCSLEEGKEYQKKLILDKEYLVEKVVVKSDDILYENAKDILFSENIEEYLVTVGNKKYLVSPSFINDDYYTLNDAILYDSSSSIYYLTEVEIIDSNSSFSDKVLVAEKLIDKVSLDNLLDYCYDDLEMKIYDKEIRNLFTENYGDYDKK